ncbi:MAG TPA: succinyl-diaminopimelate desuccinylase [Woeseiaceae bacterium]|nr:succinyl-diaminopimelate desuccinylase [Woeseiaceae bacterium]
MDDIPKAVPEAGTLDALVRGEPIAALLCDLLRRRSVTPDDAGCQALLAGRLATLGFACESLPFGKVTNLWARRGSAAPLLCFAGHTDVVPPGDSAAWQSDPFEPSLRDGLLYARGAADMKGSLAAMIVAVERFVAEHADHPGSIAFLVTSDEEGEARDGTRKVMETLCARGEKIDWCVVGEPSSQAALGDTIRIGRRGSLSGMLTVRGVQGHVAYPELADNPIRGFAPALAELYATRWDEGNDYFPPTGFEVVSIDSDAGASNVTPGGLRARFNFRYSTEWDHESLKAKVETILRSHGLEFGLRWHLSGEPFLTSPGKLTDAVSQAVLDAAGLRPELSTGGGTSDGRFIAPSGADVVELGPINASIHQVDEHLRAADLPKLCAMYRRLLERLLL